MKDSKQPQNAVKLEDRQYVFFTASAFITYVDQENEKGELPNYKTDTVSVMHRGSDPRGIPLAELAHIHQSLILKFQEDYRENFAYVTQVIPKVIKVSMINIIPLGIFTQGEFEARVDKYEAPTAEPEKKK